jgi:hypothetical protein
MTTMVHALSRVRVGPQHRGDAAGLEATCRYSSEQTEVLRASTHDCDHHEPSHVAVS